MSHGLRHVLVVGGRPEETLALCRWLAGAGHRATLLRWTERLSFADASRYRSSSIWLGAVDDGVARWLTRLSGLLAGGQYTDLWPADELAHELLCADRWRPPVSIRLIGPDANAHAPASDRCAALALARALGWATLPGIHLPKDAVAPPVSLPCIARPQRAASIVGDEPARYSIKRIADQRSLENKLRDDLPRVGLLLQSVPEGERLDIRVAAVDGEMKAADPSLPPELVAKARALVRRLRWTGLLRIECRRHGAEIRFVDLHAGLSGWCDANGQVGIESVRAMLGSDGIPRTIALWSDPVPTLARLAGKTAGVVDSVLVRIRAVLWQSFGSRASQRQLHPWDAVLFVCKGNINRSLVAEQVLRRNGFNRVASAGLLGMSGRRPSGPAERYIEDVLGAPATGLRSSSVHRAMARLQEVDLVVCFERRHVVEFVARLPELRGRVHLLTTLAGQHDGPIDIDDPHGHTDDAHRRCFERIERLLRSTMRSATEAVPMVPRPL